MTSSDCDTLEYAFTAGMRAQLTRLELALAGGMPRLGWKVGINDPAVQRRLGLDGFVVGALDGSRHLRSGETLSLSPSTRAFVEAEVAVRIARDIGGAPTAEQAWSAIGGLAPAIEVVDYSQPSDGLSTVLSHSIFHHASVIGEERPLAVFERLESGVPVLSNNGKREREAEAALRIANLGAVVARVVEILGCYDERLRADDWVLTGSWVNPAPVKAGDHVEVDFGRLGRVEVRFDRA